MKVDLTLLKKIHDSICTEATGSPDYFAEKLGISLRSFHETREFMITELSAPIIYSRTHQTYYYSHNWELYIGDLYRIKAELIKGVLDAIDYSVKLLFLIGILGV